jgi:TRAP-type transport system periplasmic protein
VLERHDFEDLDDEVGCHTVFHLDREFKKMFMRKLLLAVLSAAVIWPGLPSATELTEESVLILGPAIGSPPWEIMNDFWARVPEDSGGAITVTIQSSSELGLQGPEMVRMVRHGVANMADSTLGQITGDIPEADGMDLAGLAPDIETLRLTVNAYEESLAEIYRDRLGLEVLGIWPLAGQVIWCATPIDGLSDLQGKRIRVFTASMSDFVAALGAIPTTVAFAEVIPALQRGVVDCAVTGTVAGNIAQWTEVTTHIYPLVVGWGVHAVIANSEWWHGLDPAVREYLAAKTDEMVAIGWEQAELGTLQGLWCSTGDERCIPETVQPRPLTPTNLTLVPVSDEDREAARLLVEERALTRFAERCGTECVQRWNETVGNVLDVAAPLP